MKISKAFPRRELKLEKFFFFFSFYAWDRKSPSIARENFHEVYITDSFYYSAFKRILGFDALLRYNWKLFQLNFQTFRLLLTIKQATNNKKSVLWTTDLKKNPPISEFKTSQLLNRCSITQNARVLHFPPSERSRFKQKEAKAKGIELRVIVKRTSNFPALEHATSRNFHHECWSPVIKSVSPRTTRRASTIISRMYFLSSSFSPSLIRALFIPGLKLAAS